EPFRDTGTETAQTELSPRPAARPRLLWDVLLEREECVRSLNDRLVTNDGEPLGSPSLCSALWGWLVSVVSLISLIAAALVAVLGVALLVLVLALGVAVLLALPLVPLRALRLGGRCRRRGAVVLVLSLVVVVLALVALVGLLGFDLLLVAVVLVLALIVVVALLVPG